MHPNLKGGSGRCTSSNEHKRASLAMNKKSIQHHPPVCLACLGTATFDWGRPGMPEHGVLRSKRVI